jgi:hypothetical protein
MIEIRVLLTGIDRLAPWIPSLEGKLSHLDYAHDLRQRQ